MLSTSKVAILKLFIWPDVLFNTELLSRSLQGFYFLVSQAIPSGVSKRMHSRPLRYPKLKSLRNIGGDCQYLLVIRAKFHDLDLVQGCFGNKHSVCSFKHTLLLRLHTPQAFRPVLRSTGDTFIMEKISGHWMPLLLNQKSETQGVLWQCNTGRFKSIVFVTGCGPTLSSYFC